MEKEKMTNYEYSAAEKEVLEFWEKEGCFERLVEKNKNNERFRFLDGPITANNPMGVHHAFGRTLKDITIRYNSMNGKSCHFQNGFDAQGLWVEVEVEKSLGFRSKRDINNYGLERFTEACMERVDKMSKVIVSQSKRLGQWMDWDNSYFTNTNENILGIWHFLKVCDDKGWIVKKPRVLSWCSRCGTSLSEHEMTGSYHDVSCRSVYIKLPLKNEDASILVWTTTPWTLTSNVAIAVHPEIDYHFLRVKSTKELIICAKGLSKKIIKDDFVEVVRTVKGSELVGKEYETCFPSLPAQNFSHRIIAWEDVQETEGTGAVHIAPGCGAADYDLGKKYDLPQVCPIDDNGIILPEFGVFAGKNTEEVSDTVFLELEKQNKMYCIHSFEHSYPYCWRCKTNVVFRLVEEWYIRTDEIRPALLDAVEKVEWQPSYVKKRMVDWLNNMGDWNISRKRFYGLPLPFYVCTKCGKTTVIGSIEELKEKAVNYKEINNLHRPWIDDIKIKCSCGEETERVSDVGDCWLDAGITPFVTKGYFTDRELWEKNFPNQVVIEMVEQVRLWFYSILFMSVALAGKPPYEKVIGFGSVVQEDGSRFSKSRISIKFEDAADRIGADVIRYLYAGANQANDLRFGYSLGDEAKRKISALWNAYIFYNTYASIDNPCLDGYTPHEDTLDISCKWLIESTNKFIENADTAYREHNYQNVTKHFEDFTENLCNWYIRTNRRKFWKGADINQKNAYWTLYHSIKATCQTMAPIIPFMADYIWNKMVRTTEPREEISVHLSRYPQKLYTKAFENVLSDTEKARNIIYLALKLRNESKIMVKQPLNTLYLVAESDYSSAAMMYEDVIKDEVNVKNIEIVSDRARFNRYKLTVNFKEAGKVLKQNVNAFKDTLAAVSENEINSIVEKLSNGAESVSIGDFADVPSVLFVVNVVSKDEYAIDCVGNNFVILDLEIDESLNREGVLRQLIRQLQIVRKENGFNVNDRINLWLSSEDAFLASIIEDNSEKIADEVLAACIAPHDAAPLTISVNGADVTVKISKA